MTDPLAGRPPSIPLEAADPHTVPSGDGIHLRVYELKAGRRNQPVLVWGHANGFAAGSYVPLLERLAESYRVFAFDARAHGGSEVPHAPLEVSLHIDRFARDLGAVARFVRSRTEGHPLYYAAHSFSGVAALRLAAVFDETPWQAMTVFEPPVVPTVEFPEHAVAFRTSLGLAGLARRRRPRWASPAAFFDSLAARAPYNGFPREMLTAHTRATLQPTADGDYQLCCPPEAEARIYVVLVNASTFRALRRVRIPVHYVAGDPGPSEGPPSWAAAVQGAAAAQTPQGRLTVLKGVGHLMPFQQPETCGQLVLDMLAP